MKRWLAITSMLCVLLTGSFAWAQKTNSDQDMHDVHDVVQAQLDALARDDALTAFRLATFDKQQQFVDPDNFLRLVREQYAPIYRHRDLSFERAELRDDEALQIVRLTDADGNVWVAVFSLQRDDAHRWRIDGCELLETTSLSV